MLALLVAASTLASSLFTFFSSFALVASVSFLASFTFFVLSCWWVMAVIFHQPVQEIAILAITLLAFEIFPTVLGRTEAGTQNLAIYVEAIHSLYGAVCILIPLVREVRAEDRSALHVAIHFGLGGNLADCNTGKLTVLSEKLLFPQDIGFCDVGREANDVYHVPLHNAHLAEISSAPTTLPLFQLLCMPCAEITLLLLTRLFIFLVTSFASLVLLFPVCLLGQFLCTSCIIPKFVFGIILPARRTFAIHLLHNIMDAKETYLIIAWTGKERLVSLIQWVHAQRTALLLIVVIIHGLVLPAAPRPRCPHLARLCKALRTLRAHLCARLRCQRQHLF